MNPQYPGNQGQMPPTGYGAPPPGPGQMRPPGPGQTMYNGGGQNMYNGPPPTSQGQQFGGPYGMKPGPGPSNYGMPPQPTQNGPQPGNFPQTGGPQGDSQMSGPRAPMNYGPAKPPQGGQFQRPPTSVPNSMMGGGMPPPAQQRFNSPPQQMGVPPTSTNQLANNMGSMNLTGASPRPPSGMGQPTTIMGPPPTSGGSGGMLPTSHPGPPANRMGGPMMSPSNTGPPKPGMGMQQSNFGPGSTPMSNAGQPPVSSMGPPPMPGMGPPPVSGMGTQLSASQPPLPGMGPPPVSRVGHPPTTGPPSSFGQTGPPSGPPGLGAPPTSSMSGSMPPLGSTQTSMGGGMPPPGGQYGGYQMSQSGPNMGQGQFPDVQSNQYMGGTMPGQGYPQQPFPGQGGHRMPGSSMSGPGGMSGPAAMQQPASRKLDPDQMPSPIQVIEDDSANRSGMYQNGTRGQVPPLVTTKFTVQDQGVCNPRLMRSTMYNVPCTSDMLKTSHIPFALNISPFANIPEDEQQSPIVDLGEVGPVRCKRCKAYMNPYMMFIDGGRRFQCVFCGAATDVPAEYFAHLDHTGKRVDCYDRPELCLGSYEFVATKDYCKNGVPPNSPAFIFMIDVSYNSVKSGLVNLICERLKEDVLVNLPRETGADESEIRVGFVTYAKEIHFYNVKSNLAQPQMLVVSDLEDVFVPLLDGFLVKLSESEAVIDSLLSQIPQMFAESRETETVLGPVIQAGLDALKSADRSGKLYIFHTSLPIAEAPGKLKNRDDRKLLGTEKEKTILTPQNNFYTKLGQECVGAGCSVDLFLFPNAYIDVATISEVCRLTGGNMYKYSYFQTENQEADLDGERFIEDLKRNIQNQKAFDAILRVRTSTGIRAVDFLGNFYMANTTDVELAAIDSEHAVNVEIKHDDKLSESEGAYIQIAVLYTSVSGQRRLRILNQSLNCCTQMADLFRNCELDTLVNFMAKQMIRTSLNTNPKQVRENVMNQVAQILACYRKNCASPSSAGQLILPECMKLLPLYANCVIKSDGLQGGTEISTDDRSYLMHLINSMDVISSHVFFYPRLMPIHDADEDSLKLPKALRCSSERLQENGVYILENGISMFMWIGHNVDPHWIQEVFSVQSAAQVDIDKCKLLDLDNPTSHRVRQIVQQIRHDRKRYMKLTVVRQRDKLEPWFNHFLVEDKGTMNGTASYVDFLCHIHREIRNLLT